MGNQWAYLKKGDIVDIVAPGWAIPDEDFKNAVQYVKDSGFIPRYPRNIFDNHFLHSNSDEKRAEFLIDALQAKDSKAVWCIRGGYGSNRLLPYLAKVKKPSQTKLLIGISDITSLHAFICDQWNWNSLHAPLLDRLGKGLVSKPLQKELFNVLTGKQTNIEFKKLRPLNSAALNTKLTKGIIKGGNLAVLQSAIGTPYAVDLANTILFVEDIGERGYRVDRMLEHFKQAGHFDKCKAVIFGEFTGGEEPSTGRTTFKHVFARFASEMKFPVFTGLEAGHGVVQRPVPINVEGIIKSQGKSYILSIESGGKSR